MKIWLICKAFLFFPTKQERKQITITMAPHNEMKATTAQRTAVNANAAGPPPALCSSWKPTSAAAGSGARACANTCGYLTPTIFIP